MKNIGLKLKEKREENGLSIEEVAEDLKMRPSQITSIEEGKKDDFKDIFYLKYFIRDYAKYLGLDSEKIIDEFDDIVNKEGYYCFFEPMWETSEEAGLFILIILIIVGYIIASNYKGNDFSDNNITYSIRR